MTPSPNTTEPRNSPANTTAPAQVAFTVNEQYTAVSVDTSGTAFTDYKLYAASSDPNPRADTEPLDQSPTPPPSGRLIGDGTFTENEVYTVQLTFRDQNGNPRVLTGNVPASEAHANNMVTITLQ